MAETKRVIYYDQLSGNQPTNGDVIFVDNPNTGTHKMDLKSFVDAINNGFDSSIKSSGVTVNADNYSTIITDVNDQPVNTIYSYGAALQSKVSNLPSNKAMTIINFAQKSTGGLGQVMLAIERNGSDDYLYFRTIGGSPAVWSSWVKVANNSDVEAVREALDNLDVEINSLKADLNAVEHDIYDFTSTWGNVTLSVQTDGRYDTSGVFHADSHRRYAIIQSVTTGEHYRLSTVVSSVLIPAILFYNGDTFLSCLKTGSGTQEIVTNYEFTIPANTTKLIVQNSTSSAGEFKLEQETADKELDVYHKDEVDYLIGTSQKKYGMRYSLTDATDEGERVFDAVGLSATIGIGETNGASDFDNIYPWAGMKRCNIKRNAAGAQIITYEGETGFALDGTNGDVFVYIPKFGYERYQENGYEYHVITAPSTIVPLHPAFIDGDKILDGIYIGAYEGTDSESTLHSASGSIPTNNITPATILSYAQANGTNYSLYGIKEVSAVWVLMAVEYGCRNSNQVWGYGASNFEQPSQLVTRDMIQVSATNTNTVRTIKWATEHKGYMPIGSNITVCGDNNQQTILTQAKLTACVDDGDYTDWTFDGDPIDVDTDCFIGSAPLTTGFCDSAASGALNWHTGRADWIIGSNTRNPMRYRWIENVVGNVWHFLPDITFNNYQMYICDTIAKYGFGKTNDGYVPKSDIFAEQTSNGSKADNTGINYWIDKLNTDPFAKAIPMGRSWDTNLTSALAFGAYYYMRTGLNVVCNGGGFDHLYRSNVLTNRAWDVISIKWFLYGGRLIYKPVV